MKNCGRVSWWVLFVSLSLWCLSSNLFAQGLGGVLDKASKKLDKAMQTVESAGAAVSLPSGVSEQLRKVDQNLAKMDRMINEENSNLSKDYRSKEASSKLKEAKDGLETAERRYGSKIGKDHPELVIRRERIAAAEKSVAAFESGVHDAMKQEQEARVVKDKADDDAESAWRKQSEDSMKEQQKENEKAQEKATQGNVGPGKIVFSKSPINAASPANLTNQFNAGDNIYGLIQADKTWREIYGGKDRSELGVMVGMLVNDSDTFQYITLKKVEYLNSNQIVLDIAPAPDKMTAYKNPDIEFGEGKGNRKIGPIAFTYELGKLSSGKHTVQFYVKNYGEKPAVGSFEIKGDDYKFYADLHEKVKAAHDSGATMPPAKMTNKSLESEMRKLLDNAGWVDIRRVVIVDKDWWIVNGGQSRYLNVAVAGKGDDSQFFWANVQFTQVRLISGGWGPLKLTKTGIKRPISEKNISK